MSIKPVALIFLFSLVAFVGCSTTEATPTPDVPAPITATVESALPTVAPTPTPDIEATIEVGSVTTLNPKITPAPTPTATPTPTFLLEPPPPILILAPTSLEEISFSDGAPQVTNYPLSTSYDAFRVDGNNVLLRTDNRFDLLRLGGGGDLTPLRSYTGDLDLQVLEFDIRDGLLLLLASKGERGLPSFQIVDMNLARPELTAEVIMRKKGDHLAIEGRYAYILDNILAPFYVGIVDIADPQNPVARWLELDGVNIFLPNQTIGKLWYVLENSHSMSGVCSRVLILSKDPPLRWLASLAVGEVRQCSPGIKGFLGSRLFIKDDGLLILGMIDNDITLVHYDVSDPEIPKLDWLHTIPAGAGVERILHPYDPNLRGDQCRDRLMVQTGPKSVLILEPSHQGPSELERIVRAEAIKDIAFRC